MAEPTITPSACRPIVLTCSARRTPKPAPKGLPSKPLPYAMGDMLFYRPSELNLGVLPTPYVDNGVEVFGTLVSPGGPNT